jgi:hypothetical protein
MFNPLKPHIVELESGKFAVRKLTGFGWGFYDNQRWGHCEIWWSNSHKFIQWFECDTLEQAHVALKSTKPLKVKKVVYVS